jgi:hypothetical protein
VAQKKSFRSKSKPKLTLEQLAAIATLAATGIPLTSEQAAAYLQISAGRLAVWRCQKIGPHFVLVNTRPRYLKSELDAWVATEKPQKQVSPFVGRPRERGRR